MDYEALWCCTQCGRADLLDRTHHYCPMCGSERGEAKAVFPGERLAQPDVVRVRSLRELIEAANVYPLAEDLRMSG